MKVTSIITIEQTGIGKPDYTKDVSSARQRAGITLKYNQQLVIFALCWTDMVVHVPTPYPVPWVKPPLAPGVQAHLVDLATGLAMPYAHPAGYALTMAQKDWTCDEDIEIWIYASTAGGPLLLLACPGISPPGDNQYFNPVYTYSSKTIDPAATFAHSYDVVVVNRGAGDMEGGIVVATIVEAIGTPPFPDTKQCMCPFCQHLQTVKVGTTVIKCANCSKTYYVYDFSRIKEI